VGGDRRGISPGIREHDEIEASAASSSSAPPFLGRREIQPASRPAGHCHGRQPNPPWRRLGRPLRPPPQLVEVAPAYGSQAPASAGHMTCLTSPRAETVLPICRATICLSSILSQPCTFRPPAKRGSRKSEANLWRCFWGAGATPEQDPILTSAASHGGARPRGSCRREALGRGAL
jgi:hypothetical protein